MDGNRRKKVAHSRRIRRIIRIDDYHRMMSMRLLLLLVAFRLLGLCG